MVLRNQKITSGKFCLRRDEERTQVGKAGQFSRSDREMLWRPLGYSLESVQLSKLGFAGPAVALLWG